MGAGALLLAAAALLRPAPGGGAGCPEPGWPQHEVTLVGSQPWSAINSTNLPSSFFGIEGGHVIRAGGRLYAAITEFDAPPLWVPSRIAMWRAAVPAGGTSGGWPDGWTRVRTLFTSGGETDCRSPRASLGSSAALAWNGGTGRYELFYVGFKSCNDSNFVNRQGRIYRAVADAPGAKGLDGGFTDAGVALAPGIASQAWEGTQGVDSMQPFPLGKGRGWASFFGSAGVTPSGTNLGQRVGLAQAPQLSGPWRRAAAGNPVNLSAWVPHIEQPMVTALADGTFAAVFDALTAEGRGMIGYAWSADGLRWLPECSQLLPVAAGPHGAPWARAGVARTPQGLVEIGDGELLLAFSAYDHKLPPHYSLPSQKGVADADHESMGVARLRFGPSDPPSAARDGGAFGQWGADAAGLPVFHYTLDQIGGGKEVAERYGVEAARGVSSPVASVRQPSDHVFQIGNDRLVVLASTYGHVQVRCDEGGPKFLNDYDATAGNFGGGLAWLTDDNDRQLASSAFSEWSHPSRDFGVGYTRKAVNGSGVGLVQTLTVPFGDAPVVVSEISITNSGSARKALVLFEAWGVQPLTLSLCSENCSTPPPNASDAELWEPRRVYQREHYTTSFSRPSQHYQLSETVAHGVPTTKPTKQYDPAPVRSFLAAGPTSEAANSETTFGCDGSAFFGDGGPAMPAFVTRCGSGGAGGPAPAHVLRRTITLEREATVTLRSVFGYKPPDVSETVAALVDEYTSASFLDGLAARTSAEWSTAATHFSLPSHPEIGREVLWNYAYTRAAATKYSFNNESVIDQGTGYRYGPGGDGFEGAARDPLQHALPLLLSAPSLVKSVIRFTLSEGFPVADWAGLPSTLAQRNLPYELVGDGSPGPDAPRPQKGANHLWRPSDLELFLLWVAGEYLLTTKDAKFLSETVRYSDASSAKGQSRSVLQALSDSFAFLRNHTGVGEHGLLRALSGDWNDGFPHLMCPAGLTEPCVTDGIRRSESTLNAAMAAYALPRLADALSMADLPAGSPYASLAAAVRAFGEGQRDVLRAGFDSQRPPWTGKWWHRGWVPARGWIGDERPYLEPHPWTILAGVLELPESARLAQLLVGNLSTPVGLLTADAPNGGFPREKYMTGGAVWPAVAHPFVWALARTNGSAAWDEWRRLSLANTAAQNPELWSGVWTSSDAWGDRGLNWQPAFPALCTHRHAWPLLSLTHGLLGLEFTASGLRLRPALPQSLGPFAYSAPLFSLARDATGQLRGTYRPAVHVPYCVVELDLIPFASEIREPKVVRLTAIDAAGHEVSAAEMVVVPRFTNSGSQALRVEGPVAATGFNFHLSVDV